MKSIKINKYKEFINEAFSGEKLPDSKMESVSRGILLEYRVGFWQDMLTLSEFYNTYFSNLAASIDADPDDDYTQMKKLIRKKGWGIESLKNLFSEESDNICKYTFFDLVKGIPSVEFKEEFKERRLKSQYYEPFNGGSSLDATSGQIDIFLYKLAEELRLKGIIYLGGEGWGDMLHGEENEYLIKCAYGYHQTKYGKLFLNQKGITEQELIEKAVEDLQVWLEKNWSYGLISIGDRAIVRSMELKDFSLVESDRMIIYTSEVSDHLGKNGIKVSTEEVQSRIIKSMDVFKLDISITDEVIIIWTKFDEFR